MSEELLVYHCSPTLAGIKTGNLFTCAYTEKTELYRGIRILNHKLVPKGLRVIPLRVSDKRALIYLYRPKMLKHDLYQKEAKQILSAYGYSPRNAERCVAHLGKRLCDKREFPHEIGFFLGYPPEDVCGFIENNAACAKCIGCWKVYGDENEAKKTFAKYKKCTDIFCSQWAKGKSIERLAVAD